MSFGGVTFDENRDGDRLRAQLHRVRTLMWDQAWRTLAEISAVTGDPEASISARLRDLRKKKFGEHVMNARIRGPQELGLWEYQVIPNKETENMTEQKIVRRRLSDSEKIARAQSQIEMVRKRAVEKQKQRVNEALLLLDGVDGSNIVEAKARLTNWLMENPS